MNQDRRTFIQTSVASAAALSLANTGLAQTKRKIKKTLKFGMINDPNAKSIQEKLQVAKNAGFDAAEPNTIFNANEVKEFIAGAKTVGIHLDAIICSTHWSSPLSDPDPKVVDKTMEGMEISLNNAKAIGADVVLLVPAVVNPKVMYKDAYSRSQERVKELASIAEKLQITIGLENVWNKFLLSPIEFRRYIEEINSPYVKAFFDIGNFNFWSYPQDWIRTLDELIVRMDVKDFDNGSFKFVELLKGTVPWAEAMKACDDIGYEGYLAAEVQGGDQQYLTEAVSKAMDTIIAM
jgi:L-ribulose-5-phosphate 3-epimerase